MFMEITVFDARNTNRGRFQIELAFGKENRWTLQEKLEKGDGWSCLNFSDGSQGTFEVRDNGVIWIWDQDSTGKQRNTLIIWDAPKQEGDVSKTEGFGRIYDPSDAAFKDARIAWKTPGLTPVRKKVLEIIAKTFPAYPGNLPIPNIIDRSTSYGSTGLGKVTNCGILPGWIAKQLGYYLPWDERYKNWKFRTQEYEHKIPQSEIFKLDKGDKSPTSFTAPMAGGWGQVPDMPISSYPMMLERVRNCPGKIWIPFYGGKQNKDKRPQPGDIYVLMQDSAGHFAHVGIIIDAVGSVWRTADCGQCGTNAAAYKKRVFNKNDGTLILDPPETNIPDAGIRYLEGWIDIDQLYGGWTP
jgi:hypothetical protein